MKRINDRMKALDAWIESTLKSVEISSPLPSLADDSFNSEAVTAESIRMISLIKLHRYVYCFLTYTWHRY